MKIKSISTVNSDAVTDWRIFKYTIKPCGLREFLKAYLKLFLICKDFTEPRCLIREEVYFQLQVEYFIV